MGGKQRDKRDTHPWAFGDVIISEVGSDRSDQKLYCIGKGV